LYTHDGGWPLLAPATLLALLPRFFIHTRLRSGYHASYSQAKPNNLRMTFTILGAFAAIANRPPMIPMMKAAALK
jgi:hypothetical protein